jgi:hypothetical protein
MPAKRGKIPQDDRGLRDDLVRLVAQFALITLGGSIIGLVFHQLEAQQKADAERAKIERQEFDQLHNDLNKLIDQRIVAMYRIMSRLDGGDYAGALALKHSGYDQAVAEWNGDFYRFERGLKALKACHNPDHASSGQCASHGCIVDLYYAKSDELRLQHAYVPRPVSVHFALFDASQDFIKLFNSDWTNCLDVKQRLIERAKQSCADASANSMDQGGLSEFAKCVAKVNQTQARVTDCDVERTKLKNSFALYHQDIVLANRLWADLAIWMGQIGQSYPQHSRALAPSQKVSY